MLHEMATGSGRWRAVSAEKHWEAGDEHGEAQGEWLGGKPGGQLQEALVSHLGEASGYRFEGTRGVGPARIRAGPVVERNTWAAGLG